MFTGLVEELGIIKAIKKGQDSSVLELTANKVLEDVKRGDSIAVNGVCLTVVSFTPEEFEAQVMAETLAKTNLKNLKKGDKVNLERALRLSDRLGGHLVSGHVDGVGKIVEETRQDIATIVKIEAGDNIIDYLIPKGSVAIDGISLTIVEVLEGAFSVSLIPHTRSVTTIGYKRVGDLVNLEIDMIAKYVAKFMVNKPDLYKKRDISLDFLVENGFI